MGPERSLARISIVNFLRADHALIRHLCDRYVDARERDLILEKGALASRLCDVLTMQRQVEEETLQPEVRRKNEQMAFELVVAAHGLSVAIDEIRDAELSSVARYGAVSRLIYMARYHMAERETVLIPTLEAWFPPAQLEAMGNEYLEYKIRLRKEAVAASAAMPPADAGETIALQPPSFQPAATDQRARAGRRSSR